MCNGAIDEPVPLLERLGRIIAEEQLGTDDEG